MAADASEVEKKLRGLRKKLQQIEKIKEKGGNLDDDAQKKVASEPDIREQIAALEAGGAPAAPAAPAAVAEAPPVKPKPAAESTAQPPAAKAAAAPAPAASPAEAVAPAADLGGPNAEQEKQIRAIKKKLAQIAKLKEKGGALDAEAQEKVNSEPRLLRDLAALERGETPAEEEPPQPAAAPAAVEPAAPKREDPHAVGRAEQLEPAPGDLGLLLDDETEKRFKALQKKLREIGKLHEKDKLEKLQLDKLGAEPGLIEELAAIREKAAAKIEAKRSSMAAAKKSASWKEDSDGDCGPKRASDAASRRKPSKEDDEAEGQEEEDQAASVAKKKFDSQDLKTARQKKAPPASGKRDEPGTQVSSAAAKWPEVKEVLDSGEGGVDKARQKKAICVDHSKSGPPYDEFDQVLLRCSFLTRVELKLPPGVLSTEYFQLYFPGQLSDGLLELILKENKLAGVPPGVKDLQRIRSIDLSHNMITALPATDTWESISGSLELLDLSFNQLESVQELAPLTKLSSLKVDANKLTSLQGVSWSMLKQLSTLTVVGNQVVEIPDEIEERAESLEHLDLSENKIVNVPTALKELKKLKSLSLSGNPIKDQKAAKAAEKGIKDLKAYLSKVPKGGKR